MLFFDIQIFMLSKEEKGNEGCKKKLNFDWYKLLKDTLMLIRQAQVGNDMSFTIYYIIALGVSRSQMISVKN